jgi:hypothetical protein
MTISLSEDETKQRFGVSKEIKRFPQTLTEQEEKNVKTVLNYMDVSSLVYTYTKFSHSDVIRRGKAMT